jgi:8-oxo-dGTP pyrophosphatase MutT (NUDIX family)
MSPVTLDHARAALALKDFDVVAAQRRMAPEPKVLRRSAQMPGEARRASVMVLLFPGADGLTFPLMQRTRNPLDKHSGQISLPGGSQEPGESTIDTALRETREELGVNQPVQILGELTCLYIPPSDFEVRPVVGYVEARPAWALDATEVVEALEFPVAWLFDDARKVVEDWDYQGRALRVPWYNAHGRKVWGATAIILSEFENRLRQVINS